MEADWEEITRVTFPEPEGVSVGGLSISQHGHQQPQPNPYPTAVGFDTNNELMWIGGSNGRVASYYYARPLERYTAWRTQPEEAGVIRQFLFNDKGVIILGTKTVHHTNCRGIDHWMLHYDEKHEILRSMKHLLCMSFTSKHSEILVAGAQETMFVIDLTKGEVVKQHPTEHHYMIMKKSRAYICAATTAGSVHFLDPTSFQIIKTWQAHLAYINDMDVRGDLVVTCGGTVKHVPNQPGPTRNPDHYVNAFDLSRNAASLKPVSLAVAAAHARLHPKMSSTAVVVAPHGQVYVVDLLNPNAKPTVIKMASVSPMGVRLFEVAPSAKAFVITDGECISHLWGSPTKLPLKFTDMGVLPPIPTPPAPPHPMDWSVETPLNTIGMPFYTVPLFSSFPPDMISEVGAPPVQITQAFLASLKKAEFGWYGPNTRGTLRNQVEDTRAALERNALKTPKFLSEMEREKALSPRPKSSTAMVAKPADETPSETNSIVESLKPEPAEIYKTYEIKYSKFGVDDFNFRHFNKTAYAGLENQISNSYANPLLQLMNYTPLLRNLALQHAATSCLDDSCILCELGFVFDMLQKADGGGTCHATNMLTALSRNPDALREKLIEEENKNPPLLTNMVQGLCRFLFGQTVKDYKRCPPASTRLEQSIFASPREPLATETIVDKVLTMAVKRSHTCRFCRNAYTKSEQSHVTDLLYPAPKTAGRTGKVTQTTFSQVLKMSVERETVIKGWCSSCRQYLSLDHKRTVDGSVSAVPAVLALNAAINSPEARRLWATPGWLPQEIGIIIDGQQVFCYEGNELEFMNNRTEWKGKIAVYSLVGVVVNIEEAPPLKHHLAALINVAHSEAEPPSQAKWHLFNDFSVRPVSTAEALAFNMTWKSPSVIMYHLKAANNRSNPEWKTRLDTSVLFREPRRQPAINKCQPLDRQTEMPGPQSVVALDAEFVQRKNEEIHHSAGVTETIRPKQLSLARVSVIRGEGDKLGSPFIDDYISIKGHIDNYLTEYSGIREGDLDPRTSKHNLVSLKVAYKKLWVLLNLGCKFVGHGLKSDLRVINIQIPRAQIADTLDLYSLAGLAERRTLSLKFLSWCVLEEKIQVTTHDSIEDARAALMLYRRYLEAEEEGMVEPMLTGILNKGRRYKFKPPLETTTKDDGNGSPPTSNAPEAAPAAADGGSTGTTASVSEDGLDKFNPRKVESVFSA
ncbi:PAB-dependent poly(A)-specific ribonuclease subunit PAN2 [Naviculisporaceae sp. PSN 640]